MIENKQKDDGFEITITTGDPQLRTQLGGANKYYLYQITGQDRFSNFSVFRRFSDFVILKNTMILRWPGCYIPSLPQKKFLGNNQSTFVYIRKQGLQRFLQLIAQAKPLWYSDEFQLFIKNNSSEVDKSLGNLGKTNPRQIHAKYTTVFPQISDKADLQAGIKITEFTAYLKGVVPILQKLIKSSEAMNQTRNKFIQKYDGLFKIFLHDYEDKCMSQYVQDKDKDNLYFLNQKENGFGQLRQKLSQLNTKNSILFANQLIKEELRQVLNFQDILKLREQYQAIKSKAMAKVKDVELEETKINAGKQSIFSKIKNLSKEQQLQEKKSQLQKARQQQKEASQICQVVEYMLKQKQIQNFKKVRKENYYRVVKELANSEKKIYELETEIWEKISGEDYGSSLKEDKQEMIEEIKTQVVSQEKVQNENVVVHFYKEQNKQQNQEKIEVKKEEKEEQQKEEQKIQKEEEKEEKIEVKDEEVQEEEVQEEEVKEQVKEEVKEQVREELKKENSEEEVKDESQKSESQQN